MPRMSSFQSSLPSPAEVFSFLKRYWLAFAIAIIAVAFTLAYLAGYRISTGLTVVRVGTLTVTDLPPDARVFVDYDSRGMSSTGIMVLPLMPGNHTVIVSENGMNPWETIVTIATNKTMAVDPILIPTKATVSPLSAADTAAAKAAIAGAKLPTAAAPLVVGCSSLTIDNNRIVADTATSTPGCTPPAYQCTAGSCAPTIVFSPINTIREVFAYPGRTDAMLVVAGNDLYAVGLDPRTPQTFAVLLSAPGIMAGALTSGHIVVQNGTGVYALSI